MPLVTGLEAKSARKNRFSDVPSVETGRPETSKEFAKRMKKFVRVAGPRRAQEGGSTLQQQEIASTSGSRVEKQLDSYQNNSPEHSKSHDSDMPELVPESRDALPANALAQILTRSSDGIDLLAQIKNKYDQDPFYKKIVEAPKDFKNFEYTDGLVYQRLSDSTKVLCIPRILVNGRSSVEIVISEAHSLLAHLGPSKTLTYLREQVWWKDMVTSPNEMRIRSISDFFCIV
ncbi:hypothetical protein K435DRAFT_703038 [Dendrothele bispora CBS 962.96]|uniref:Integrase zinc-binding domain-containing protein n=1 Tax=Dendrothele bispora (strain CBS 962.96) TaxID=1314807 RepID=A0A4S8KNE0_DENBC|nr:hypothetical protein K435DRAFT_703038 [Dendrothele bispora CBS 962.96]